MKLPQPDPMTVFVSRNGGPPHLPPPSRWQRARRAVVELSAETIEQIALRVARLLEEREPQHAPIEGLVDAGELARLLGVTRAWVYQHAQELGAVRIGSGPRARLRFDVEGAREALDRGTRVPRHESRSPSSFAPNPAPLLPVTPRRVRGLAARVRRRRRTGGR